MPELAVGICSSCRRPWPACACGRPTTDADREQAASRRFLQAFPIVDAASARSAVIALFLPVNDERRKRHPGVVEKVLRRAAEFGVEPGIGRPEVWDEERRGAGY